MRGRFAVALNLWRRGIFDPFVLLNAWELRRCLLGCDSVVDVGCGNASPLQDLKPPQAIGIDGYQPSLEAARRSGTHSEFIQGDIRQLNTLCSPGQFHACIALDVIEHLPKEDGYKLIRDMEAIASRRVVFLTPNGFLPQRHRERDDLQEHLSGWTADEMRALGYSVIGLLGPKRYRGEFHQLKRSPKGFWYLLSLVQHFVRTRSAPEDAAAILCWKDTARGA